MPLSRDRNRQRMRLERKAAKMAHWGLSQKREETNARLEKAFSPSAGSKAVQPTALEREALDPINNPSQFLPPDTVARVITGITQDGKLTGYRMSEIDAVEPDDKEILDAIAFLDEAPVNPSVTINEVVFELDTEGNIEMGE